jgi:hypothetical protein
MKRGKNFFRDCKGIVSDYLPWLLLALIGLIIFFIAIGVMKVEGVSLIDKLKNILSFKNGN